VAEWRRLHADTWGAQVHVFAGELKDGAEIYARMFAPAFGISEDPATGAAAAAIVGAAAARGRDGEIRLKILQGVAMGRPSLLNASAKVEGGAVFSIEVGGSCVLVAEGTIEVPGSSLDQPTG
jgi:trans-2,3-dihydro-3-hydroxyanthranilate isomerase